MLKSDLKNALSAPIYVIWIILYVIGRGIVSFILYVGYGILLFIGLFLYSWDTSGRFNRSRYAITSFVLFLLMLSVEYLLHYYVTFELWGLPLLIVWVFFKLTWFAASIQRFHDVGFSGWYVLLLLVPVVNILTTLYLFIIPGTETNLWGQG